MKNRPRYPGIRVTANGNQLVSYHTETRIARQHWRDYQTLAPEGEWVELAREFSD